MADDTQRNMALSHHEDDFGDKSDPGMPKTPTKVNKKIVTFATDVEVVDSDTPRTRRFARVNYAEEQDSDLDLPIRKKSSPAKRASHHHQSGTKNKISPRRRSVISSAASDDETDNKDYFDSEEEYGAVQHDEDTPTKRRKAARREVAKFTLKKVPKPDKPDEAWRKLYPLLMTTQQTYLIMKEEYDAVFPKMTAEQERATKDVHLTVEQKMRMACLPKTKTTKEQRQGREEDYISMIEYVRMDKERQNKLSAAQKAATSERYVTSVEREHLTSQNEPDKEKLYTT